MATHKVLIAGEWKNSESVGTFHAKNPRTRETLPDAYPVSSWADCDAALDAAQQAFAELRELPAEKTGAFLEAYADRIEARASEICELASLETALPVEPRLASGELPRTTGQLRQAAKAAKSADWTTPVIDTSANIRSHYAPIGPVAVFGPNNFPLAFGSISGGDFAAAIASGNPVIGKAHPLHPGTTRILAEEAKKAADDVGLPAGTVQLLYNLSYDDGERLAKDARLSAIAFTGSRRGGLKLKAAADTVGKPCYLELGSINPVVVLPGALDERADEISAELTGSCLMGAGQFCTNPRLILVEKGDKSSEFIEATARRFVDAPNGVLFSESGLEGLSSSIDVLTESGAETVAGAAKSEADGYSYANTILKVSGDKFLSNTDALQTEAFGNATLIVEADSTEQVREVVESLEGNLTGSIYSATNGSDEAAYERIAPELRQRVGRLLNDKMPTGVAVSPAMNHGGPYPATSHGGFTAVGIPGSLRRFAMLQCYDNVRANRLPVGLRDENALGTWRLVDGRWTQSSL
ncbi:MAG: aldehyde dehydrogenase (NADP(+)) [Rhodothermales bacterium]|nr:aldehyde dehydrogenase (NADP(+)) [Rhodothermales bacterium]